MHPEGAMRNGMGVTNSSFTSLSSFKDKAGMKGPRSAFQRWQFAFCNLSNRVKLLTGMVVVVLLTLYCTSRAASIMGWDDQYSERQALTPSRHRYTVLINTWKRYELLKKTVTHYSSCKNVDAVNVIWSEPQPPTKELHSRLIEVTERHQVEFRLNINKVDDLNNRFKPIAGIRTDAVFSVDDDLVVPCPTMDLAFSMWLSAPRSMVGFVPRMHWPQKSKHGHEYTYGGWWSVWWTGTYSIILTKASFLHKDYLDLYTSHMPSSILNYVKQERNCEDIAMSFLVANATNAPPLWVKGQVDEIGSTGISSLSGHTQHRTACINYFVDVFGHMPLVSTRVKATDASKLWLW